MDNNKNPLRWLLALHVGAVVAVACSGMLGMLVSKAVAVLLGVGSILAFGGLEFWINRCPHCGCYLGRNWGEFCQFCGRRIREQKTDT